MTELAKPALGEAVTDAEFGTTIRRITAVAPDGGSPPVIKPILFYVDGKDLIRYHVGAGTKEVVTTFDFCSGGASAGSDPLFMSWDSNRIGLACDEQVFIYDIGQNTVLARKALDEDPAQVAPGGTLAFLSDSGGVTDPRPNVVRTLDLLEPYGHASLSMVNGHDTWNLGEPYWAEPHTVPSHSGTRAVFGSDWGNGATVDTYVIELPSYKP